MSDKPDPDLWKLVVALHNHCRSRGIELIAAARFLGSSSVIVSRVGEPEAVIDLLDEVRTSLCANDDDQTRQ